MNLKIDLLANEEFLINSNQFKNGEQPALIEISQFKDGKHQVVEISIEVFRTLTKMVNAFE